MGGGDGRAIFNANTGRAVEGHYSRAGRDDNQEFYTGIWQRICTKHIDSPSTFYPYKAVPVALCSAILECLYWKRPSAVTNVCAASNALEKYDYPIYYVSDPMLQAMLHTEPPESI